MFFNVLSVEKWKKSFKNKLNNKKKEKKAMLICKILKLSKTSSKKKSNHYNKNWKKVIKQIIN